MPVPLIIGRLIVALRADALFGVTLACAPCLPPAIMMFSIFAGGAHSPHGSIILTMTLSKIERVMASP